MKERFGLFLCHLPFAFLVWATIVSNTSSMLSEWRTTILVIDCVNLVIYCIAWAVHLAWRRDQKKEMSRRKMHAIAMDEAYKRHDRFKMCGQGQFPGWRG